ncbi:MAG: hypothetical protein DRJ10_08180 [Bacteroidetes bacterium]|nr:MAG: hypothetical protein DRJ10_08180 [Bacteroidota bacterium]
MKKALIILSALFLLFTVMPTEGFSQVKTRNQLKKERKDQRKKIKEKALKKARKEAKRLAKDEGWSVFPGDKPLDKMLEDSWMKQYEMKLNNDMSETNAYIWATGNGVSKTKSAAKMQAMELAKVELAGQLKTHVAALTTSNIANAQLSSVDAETEMSIVQSAKSITSATLTQLKPIVVLYRTKLPKKELKKNNRMQLAPGTVEVQVMIYYDLYQVDLQTRETIKQELKDKLKDNEEELKKLMDL